MKFKDYLKYSLDNQLPLKLAWAVAMFSVGKESNDYVRKDKGIISVKVNDEWVALEDRIPTKQIIDPTDEIKIEAGFIVNLKEDVTTTIGRILLNYVLLVYNFNNKVDYINHKFDVGYIEDNIIASRLVDDKTKKDNGISIDEYISFVDSAVYLQNWADLVSVSATPKSLIAPDGIKEYKKKLMDEAIKEHGPDALKDYTVIADIETKLKAYDKEFLKDDPSLGKLMGGKMLNNSRKKLFLMTGADKNFNGEEDDALLISDTLEDGLSSDPEELAAHFNGIRFASYSRGSETFKGGLTAKILLRATSAIVIRSEDCKTKAYKEYPVDSDNYKHLVGRYVMISDKPVVIEDIEDAKKYIGKTIKLRSAMYCIAKGEDICKTCAGKGLSENENSVPLIVTNIGATILALSMKKMHKMTIETVKLDMNDMIS